MSCTALSKSEHPKRGSSGRVGRSRADTCDKRWWGTNFVAANRAKFLPSTTSSPTFSAALLHDTLPQPGQTSMMASSRIFVKNIPSTITEKDFRNHFSANGREITDVKILPHRRIGYVGYKTPDVAENAVKYFNRTFIRMSRVAVELAKPVSSTPPFHISVQPWPRSSSSSHKTYRSAMHP